MEMHKFDPKVFASLESSLERMEYLGSINMASIPEIRDESEIMILEPKSSSGDAFDYYILSIHGPLSKLEKDIQKCRERQVSDEFLDRRFLDYLLPPKKAEETFTELEATFYDYWSVKYSEKEARRIFKIQQIYAVLHFHKTKVVTALGLLGLNKVTSLFK